MKYTDRTSVDTLEAVSKPRPRPDSRLTSLFKMIIYSLYIKLIGKITENGNI